MLLPSAARTGRGGDELASRRGAEVVPPHVLRGELAAAGQHGESLRMGVSDRWSERRGRELSIARDE